MSAPAKPQHLHYQVSTAIGEMIEVTLDHAANVLIMTTMQYDAYKNGERTSTRGGWVTKSPVKLKPPYSGVWHVVIDSAGQNFSVRASCSIIKGEED